MRALPYLVFLTVLLGVLLAGGMFLVSAQSSPQQYVGDGGGMIRGQVLGFNMYNQLIPIAWAPVTASNGQYSFAASSGGDGNYEMFVPAGVYNVTVATPGYTAYSASVAVSDGSTSSINFYLEQSHVPVPEFPQGAFTVVLFAAMASVLLAQRITRKRKQSR